LSLLPVRDPNLVASLPNMPAPLAVILDFNGTISDDEPLLDRLFQEVLLEEAGVELTSATYFAKLSGLSDPEIVVRALALGGVDPKPEQCAAILRAKIDRYKEEVVRELTISEATAGFVSELAVRVPIAIASGAVREEIEFVLERAGLHDIFAAIVCIDDVEDGKPDPEGYVLALRELNDGLEIPIAPADVLAIEDSAAGITAAHIAGFRCAAVAGDERAESVADFTITELTPESAAELFRT
jgi:beta-phosphoglucomutase